MNHLKLIQHMHAVKTTTVTTTATQTVSETETKSQTLVVPYIIQQLNWVDTWYYTKIKIMANNYDADNTCSIHCLGKTATDK